jgi:hypothetical protein
MGPDQHAWGPQVTETTKGLTIKDIGRGRQPRRVSLASEESAH